MGQVVFRDTDSCGILGVPQDLTYIESQFKTINTLINRKLQASLGNTHMFNFVPEVDNY
jgi:hypothetical protein